MLPARARVYKSTRVMYLYSHSFIIHVRYRTAVKYLNSVLVVLLVVGVFCIFCILVFFVFYGSTMYTTGMYIHINIID